MHQFNLTVKTRMTGDAVVSCPSCNHETALNVNNSGIEGVPMVGCEIDCQGCGSHLVVKFTQPKKATTLYTVIYRMGGTENFSWHKAEPVRGYAAACEGRDEIERGGRKALIHETDAINRIGLPETYGPNDPIV